MDRLQTGDVLLFHNTSPWYNVLIEKITNSPLCHSGLVIRDPWFTKEPLKGLYVLQSTYNDIPDAEDNKVKFGVQITKLEDCCKQYEWTKVRSLVGIDRNSEEFKKKFAEIHKQVHDVPYDLTIKYWLIAGLNHLKWTDHIVKRHIDCFWCSALVAYVYTQMGWFSEDTDWSELAPSDLAVKKPTGNLFLSEEWELNINNDRVFDIGEVHLTTEDFDTSTLPLKNSTSEDEEPESPILD